MAHQTSLAHISDYIGATEMTLLVIFSTFIILKIRIDLRYRFFLKLFVFMLISDFCAGLMDLSNFFEDTPG